VVTRILSLLEKNRKIALKSYGPVDFPVDVFLELYGGDDDETVTRANNIKAHSLVLKPQAHISTFLSAHMHRDRAHGCALHPTPTNISFAVGPLILCEEARARSEVFGLSVQRLTVQVGQGFYNSAGEWNLANNIGTLRGAVAVVGPFSLGREMELKTTVISDTVQIKKLQNRGDFSIASAKCLDQLLVRFRRELPQCSEKARLAACPPEPVGRRCRRQPNAFAAQLAGQELRLLTGTASLAQQMLCRVTPAQCLEQEVQWPHKLLFDKDWRQACYQVSATTRAGRTLGPDFPDHETEAIYALADKFGEPRPAAFAVILPKAPWPPAGTCPQHHNTTTPQHHITTSSHHHNTTTPQHHN
jgi:hypothetical protein